MPDNYLPTLPTSTPALGQPQDQGFDPLSTRDLPASFGLTNFQDLKNYQPPAQTKPSVWQTVMQSIGQGMQGYGYATMNPEQQQIYNQNEQAKGAQAAKIAQLRQQQQDQQTANEQFQQTRADTQAYRTSELSQKASEFQATKDFQASQLAQNAQIHADTLAELAKQHKETAMGNVLTELQKGNYNPEQAQGMIKSYSGVTGIPFSAEDTLGLMNARAGANQGGPSKLVTGPDGTPMGVTVGEGANAKTYMSGDKNNPMPDDLASSFKAAQDTYTQAEDAKTQRAVDAQGRVFQQQSDMADKKQANTARNSVTAAIKTPMADLSKVQSTVDLLDHMAIDPNNAAYQSQLPGLLSDLHKELGGVSRQAANGSQAFVNSRGAVDGLGVALGKLTAGQTLTPKQVLAARDIANQALEAKTGAVNTLKTNAINNAEGIAPGSTKGLEGPAVGKFHVNQVVTIKGKPHEITAVHPDGTFDAKPLK